MTQLLTQVALDKLPTKRLLAYKKKLMQVPETADWGDYDHTGPMTKESPDWQETYAAVKAILATREHVG